MSVTRIERSVLLPFSAEQMYLIVNDVARYPEFLANCCATEVLSVSPTAMRARLELAKAGFKQSFITRNRLEANRLIQLELEEGPFRLLSGQWLFLPLDAQASKTSFKLEFEFQNRLMNLAFSALFNQVAGSLVDSFAKRAKVLYGSNSG